MSHSQKAVSDNAAVTPASTPPAEPLFLGDAQRPLWAWLHRSAGAAGLGVVMCPPLGHEMTNVYRSWREMAEAVAAQGVPVLRMDYPHSGNSADLPASVPRVDACLGAIATAAQHLRASTGVRQVALVGLRSGALLALAAAKQAQASGVLALAPVPSGLRLVREWRALHAAAGLPSVLQDGSLEVAGYVFNASDLKDLESLDSARIELPPALALTVLERDDLPASGAWAEALAQRGAVVQREACAGFGPMLDEPQHHVVPLALVQRVADQCARWAVEGGSPSATTSRVPVTIAGHLAGGAEEKALWLEEQGVRLFGVWCQPSKLLANTPVVLLPNTGAVHHVGGHRLLVMLARHLAAAGVASWRFDLSGLGDSPARVGQAHHVIYGPLAHLDMALAVRQMQRHRPSAMLHALGLCSGAYQILKHVVAQDGLTQAVMVNPLVYFWDQNSRSEDQELAVQAQYYRNKWRDPARWWRLLSGKSDFKLLFKVVAGRLSAGALKAWRREPATDIPDPAGSQDLSRELVQAAVRGSRLHFAFSPMEPGLPLLHRLAGPKVQAMQRDGALCLHALQASDHTFSNDDSRQRFVAWAVSLLAGSHAAQAPRVTGTPKVKTAQTAA